MRRLIALVAFMIVTMLAAGAFGILHDQISYTVSNEYFTRFKFPQFQLLDAGIPERIRVAEVGFLASWWMGIPLGLLTGIAGFVHPTARQMRKALLLSLAVISVFTLTFALVGLAYGFIRTTHLNLSEYAGWFVPQGLERPRNFICVGYMHNSAYLGGLIAIPIAWWFHFIYRQSARAIASRDPCLPASARI